MEKRLIFRLPEELYNQVKTAIEKGKAKNQSELIRSALMEFLSEHH